MAQDALTSTMGTGNFGMSPSFSDIQKNLQPQQVGTSSDVQSAIDLINKQRDYYAGLGASNAQGLALSRGQAGSSTEQFGVQQAINQTNQAALGATGNLLQQNMQNNLQQRLQLGQLTSDEIASLRNMGLSQQYMGLQQSLGQQGINLGYANMDAARQYANQQSRNQLIGAGANLLGSGAFGNLFGGGGGGGLFGGSGTGGGGGLFGNFGGNVSQAFGGGSLSGTGYGGAGSPSSSLFPGGLGPQGVGTGTGMGGMQLGGGMGLGANLAGGGVGMLAGQQAFGNNRYSNIGGIGGGIMGSMFGPIGAGLGSFAGEGVGAAYGGLSNLGKSAVTAINPFAAGGTGISNVVKSIGSVFPF
jgi:hypothetical protein